MNKYIAITLFYHDFIFSFLFLFDLPAVPADI